MFHLWECPRAGNNPGQVVGRAGNGMSFKVPSIPEFWDSGILLMRTAEREFPPQLPGNCIPSRNPWMHAAKMVKPAWIIPFGFQDPVGIPNFHLRCPVWFVAFQFP